MIPYTGYQRPRPRPARRRTAIVLGVVAATLFLAAGVFAGLYVLARQDHDAVVARLDERRGEFTELARRTAAAEEARDEAVRRNADLEHTRTDLAACVDAVRHYLWDDLADTARNTALDQMFVLCR